MLNVQKAAKHSYIRSLKVDPVLVFGDINGLAHVLSKPRHRRAVPAAPDACSVLYISGA